MRILPNRTHAGPGRTVYRDWAVILSVSPRLKGSEILVLFPQRPSTAAAAGGGMRPSGSALSSFSAGGGSSLFATADAASSASEDEDAENDHGGGLGGLGGGGSPPSGGGGGRRGMFSPFPQHRPFVTVEKTCWDDHLEPLSLYIICKCQRYST